MRGYKNWIAGIGIFGVSVWGVIVVLGPTVYSHLQEALVMALLAAAWDFMYAGGVVNLGLSALFGVGAYTYALVKAALSGDMAAIVAMAAAAGAGCLASICFVLPALRLRGAYLSIVTLVIPVLLQGVVLAFSKWTGGELGLYGFEQQGVTTGRFLWTFLIVIIGIALLSSIANGRFGRIISGVRQDDILAAICGISVPKIRGLTCAVSGLVCGIAGALYARYLGVVGPGTLSFEYSIYPLLYSILGGAGTVYAPALAALGLHSLLAQLLLIVPELRITIFGLIGGGIVLLVGGGIVDRICGWLCRKLLAACR